MPGRHAPPGLGNMMVHWAWAPTVLRQQPKRMGSRDGGVEAALRVGLQQALQEAGQHWVPHLREVHLKALGPHGRDDGGVRRAVPVGPPQVHVQQHHAQGPHVVALLRRQGSSPPGGPLPNGQLGGGHFGGEPGDVRAHGHHRLEVNGLQLAVDEDEVLRFAIAPDEPLAVQRLDASEGLPAVFAGVSDGEGAALVDTVEEVLVPALLDQHVRAPPVVVGHRVVELYKGPPSPAQLLEHVPFLLPGLEAAGHFHGELLVAVPQRTHDPKLGGAPALLHGGGLHAVLVDDGLHVLRVPLLLRQLPQNRPPRGPEGVPGHKGCGRHHERHWVVLGLVIHVLHLSARQHFGALVQGGLERLVVRQLGREDGGRVGHGARDCSVRGAPRSRFDRAREPRASGGPRWQLGSGTAAGGSGEGPHGGEGRLCGGRGGADPECNDDNHHNHEPRQQQGD
mmetsp:Transcript_19758/g.33070  ORF Transcript_19758/g.33070 Transcript_19758/m.33070 type:complete len:451 (+) Transcript_19758:40-1392(+)